MAPIRRYLRITKYSVLECRIYLDNPALAQTWLLNPRNPMLPRVIESVRPLVLPKLREEKERSRKKSTKKKSIRDVVVEDDFEVAIFLTETSTRHSLLTKQKHFRDTPPKKLGSNSNKLTGDTHDSPFDVDGESANVPILLREESDDDAAELDTIPAIAETVTTRQSKRLRGAAHDRDVQVELSSDEEDTQGGSPFEIDSDSDAPPSKRPRQQAGREADVDEEDDKKKMAMDVSYEGFAIYGRVLCLVVKKRESLRAASSAGRAGAGSESGKPGGQAMMENWISSTQMPAGEDAS